MAVDTAAKRAAAANFDGWHLPFPDGGNVDSSPERAAVLWLYSMAAGDQPAEGDTMIYYTGMVVNVGRLMNR